MANDLQALVPASVTVSFPKTDANGVLTTNCLDLSATLASLDLTEYEGIVGHAGTKRFTDNCIAVYAGGADPTNLAQLTALVAQLASDWYRWQLADVDVSLPGIVPWAPGGMTEITWKWDADNRMTRTRVMRPEWNDVVERVGHWGAAGAANNSPGGGPGTNIINFNSFVNNTLFQTIQGDIFNATTVNNFSFITNQAGDIITVINNGPTIITSPTPINVCDVDCPQKYWCVTPVTGDPYCFLGTLVEAKAEGGLSFIGPYASQQICAIACDGSEDWWCITQGSPADPTGPCTCSSITVTDIDTFEMAPLVLDRYSPGGVKLFTGITLATDDIAVVFIWGLREQLSSVTWEGITFEYAGIAYNDFSFIMQAFVGKITAGGTGDLWANFPFVVTTTTFLQASIHTIAAPGGAVQTVKGIFLDTLPPTPGIDYGTGCVTLFEAAGIYADSASATWSVGTERVTLDTTPVISTLSVALQLPASYPYTDYCTFDPDTHSRKCGLQIGFVFDCTGASAGSGAGGAKSCMFGTSDEATAMAALTGGSFTGPYATKPDCDTACGTGGSGGPYNTCGACSEDFPDSIEFTPTGLPCPELNVLNTLEMVVDGGTDQCFWRSTPDISAPDCVETLGVDVHWMLYVLDLNGDGTYAVRLKLVNAGNENAVIVQYDNESLPLASCGIFPLTLALNSAWSGSTWPSSITLSG